MKILIIGSGGREHALAWRLAKSPDCRTLLASPGNPGIAQLATCLPAPANVSDFAGLAEASGVDLTIVGPEAPLVAGVVDSFRNRGMRIIGPTMAAAQLEGSKIFAKRFFHRCGIPTAVSVQTSSYEQALEALRGFSFPLVVKADGLHSGKGVIIAGDQAEALSAIRRLGPHLVIEEFLTGEEVSFIGLADGIRFIPFAPAQDHKQLLDGDLGPNTGGMGAYVDQKILTPNLTSNILERVIYPTLQGMVALGSPFSGFLFAGLIMTEDGPKILEYNVRLGDPETQAIMHSFEGDLLSSFNDFQTPLHSVSSPSVALTLAAQDYPSSPIVGDPITGLAEAEDSGATVFQAGTRLADGRLVTNGGRVLSVTASDTTLQAAIDSAYHAAAQIRFRGMHYRTDIGRKGLHRW